MATLCMGASTTTFAAESSDYHIVCENISMRVAEETIDSVKYIYTFEKETNILKTETYNVSNLLTSTKYLDLSSVSTDYSIYEQQLELASNLIISIHFQITNMIS